jgi:regulator of protease activity HflC (stomatin/prohibitin superfamily)
MKTKIGKKGQGDASFLLVILLVVVVVAGFFFGYPIYNVWSSEKAGEAQLAQANYNRQIAVVEAEAKLQAAKSLAQAEVERAKGVAQANQIIGESLKNNEDYLRYLWITDVAGTNVDKTIVYVPTETNLPILEATRSTIK